MSWKSLEELMKLVDDLRHKVTVANSVFPNGLPSSQGELTTAKQKEAYYDLISAWQLLRQFVEKHPLLGAS